MSLYRHHVSSCHRREMLLGKASVSENSKVENPVNNSISYPWSSIANTTLNFRQLLSEIVAHRVILDSEASVSHSQSIKSRFKLKKHPC